MSPRFHLSTLLLLCLFAGAIIGLFLTSEVWQLKSSNEVRRQEGGMHDLAISDDGTRLAWFDSQTVLLFDARTGRELWRANVDDTPYDDPGISFTDTDRIIEVVRFHRHRMTVLKYDAEKGRMMLLESTDIPTRNLKTEGPDNIEPIFSSNGRFKIERDAERIRIYGRARPNGWEGFSALPVFWIAVLSSLALAVTFVRWLRRPRRVPAPKFSHGLV